MNPGDAITFTYQGKQFTGVLLTVQESEVTVKLSNGYNMIVPRTEMGDVKAQPVQKTAPAKHHVKQDPTLPHITILHTGGTIASKVDYKTGAVAAQTTPDELLAMYPELHDLANIEAKLVSNIFSEDMNFGHYNLIAREIQAAVQAGANGIIITHGTDTMHYTAAALSFILEDLSVPVILVGSQRSSDRGSSDASTNLLAAMRFVTKTDFAGVAICMQATGGDCHILQGVKARKLHSSRRDAFKAVNTAPIATVGKEITFHKEYRHRQHTMIKVHPMDESITVGILYVHPNLKAQEVRCFKGYDGLLIMGLGIGGHIPLNTTDDLTAENAKVAAALQELIAAGTVVAAATQTIFGRLNMDVYSTGRRMQELGIIGHNHDMPPETAFIKLAWVLSNYKEMAKELFLQDLAGEISSRSPLEDDQ